MIRRLRSRIGGGAHGLTLCLAMIVASDSAGDAPRPYVVVDTGQDRCYDDAGEIACPASDQPFYGQDAQHAGPAARYQDNGDGTVRDLNTGLTWVRARGEMVTWEAARADAARSRVGGHSDWRVPTIKELYSLIDFKGGFHLRAADSTPYLDTRFFEFLYGDEARGERGIDCQDWSATEYADTATEGGPKVFGVNFADGRIKGYGKRLRDGRDTLKYVRYVRGNPAYGRNDLRDNGDGTLTDRATGLMWARADSGRGMDWQAALAWVQQRNAGRYLGYDDWRLPDAKELQSIVDYGRAPGVTGSAAISPLFEVTRLADGEYPFFWSSTTHLDGPPDRMGGAAVYLAFGRATGWMGSRPDGPPGGRPGFGGLGGPRPGGPDPGPSRAGSVRAYRLLDVHGAGAQRSDPKTGNPAAFPHGRGPQGDVVRILNFVRCVRGPVGPR